MKILISVLAIMLLTSCSSFNNLLEDKSQQQILCEQMAFCRNLNIESEKVQGYVSKCVESLTELSEQNNSEFGRMFSCCDKNTALEYTNKEEERDYLEDSVYCLGMERCARNYPKQLDLEDSE